MACGRIQGMSVIMNEWKKKQRRNQHHKHLQSQGNSERGMLVFGGVCLNQLDHQDAVFKHVEPHNDGAGFPSMSFS